MDLNELLYAHQLEVMKSGKTGDTDHFERIAEYVRRIRQLRETPPYRERTLDSSAPTTIIYGSYAGIVANDDKVTERDGGAEEPAHAPNENPDRGQTD